MKALRMFRMFLALGFIAALTQAHSSPMSVVKTRIAVALSSVHNSLDLVLADRNLTAAVQTEASQWSGRLHLEHQLERLWDWARNQTATERTRGGT